MQRVLVWVPLLLLGHFSLEKTVATAVSTILFVLQHHTILWESEDSVQITCCINLNSSSGQEILSAYHSFYVLFVIEIY